MVTEYDPADRPGEQAIAQRDAELWLFEGDDDNDPLSLAWTCTLLSLDVSALRAGVKDLRRKGRQIDGQPRNEPGRRAFFVAIIESAIRNYLWRPGRRKAKPKAVKRPHAGRPRKDEKCETPTPAPR